MGLSNYTIDHLIYLREKSRKVKNFELSDKIRDYLDSKHVFIFDTEKGQTIYHELSGTRQDLINKLNKHTRLENIFNAWLYSILKQQK